MTATRRGDWKDYKVALRRAIKDESQDRVEFSDQPDPGAVPGISLRISAADHHDMGSPLVLHVSLTRDT